MLLLREAHPDRPAYDMAVTHALLETVAAGELGAALRLFQPGPTLALGRLDAAAPGFAAAAAAARAHGFEPVVRLGGGHAAAYDEGSVLVEWVVPVTSVAGGLRERFAAAADTLLGTLTDLGVRAAIGELPREYCAGEFSIHAEGPPKLAGIAQRVVKGAALTTAFVAVEGGDRLRAVLGAVYAALGIDLDPATVGAADDVAPYLTAAAVADALATGTPAALPHAVLDRAERHVARHAVP